MVHGCPIAGAVKVWEPTERGSAAIETKAIVGSFLVTDPRDGVDASVGGRDRSPRRRAQRKGAFVRRGWQRTRDTSSSLPYGIDAVVPQHVAEAQVDVHAV